MTWLSRVGPLDYYLCTFRIAGAGSSGAFGDHLSQAGAVED